MFNIYQWLKSSSGFFVIALCLLWGGGFIGDSGKPWLAVSCFLYSAICFAASYAALVFDDKDEGES